jgi:carbonic anhydrase/acetyltransferase-like protein (isoleucine patch superfamily)
MLMLLHRAGVTIGDGCVVGAGSIVTKSVPAYHVIIGNPARAHRKVVPDVFDAPGLIYEVKGDRVFVVGNRPLQEDRKTPDQEK